MNPADPRRGPWLLGPAVSHPIDRSARVADTPLLAPFVAPAVAVAVPEATGVVEQAPDVVDGLQEVAERLERIARVMRNGNTADLLASSSREADPLELLITGYALGYMQGQKRTRPVDPPSESR